MKKILLLLIPLVLLLCICLGACKEDTKPVDTDETTTARTRGEQVDFQSMRAKYFGLFPYSVESSDLYVAEANVTSSGTVTVRGYEEGTATLTIKDYWDHAVTMTAKVEGGALELTVNEPFSSEQVVNVRLAGASGNGSVDDTEAIQAAIDSLPNGGEVLVPAGIYSVSRLILHEGIQLKLQGKADNVKLGYTDELAEQVNGGQEFAVLQLNIGGTLLYNHDPSGSGNLGESNITVSGGVIDMNGAIAAGKVQVDTEQAGPMNLTKASGTGAVIISCGENFLFENVIFKDVYNGHVMQLTGVSNVNIRDCMFAGYVCRSETKGSSSDITITREVIQIEYAHSGAIPPSTFEAGEFYYCENISITGCYFGDSDKCADPLTCIGQHGANGPANCDYVTIEDNVFDNPYYCALRMPNYTNVSIKNNVFLSERKGRPNGYFIELLMITGDRTYTDSQNRTVLVAKSYEIDGLQNFTIENNDFQITGESNKRVLSAVSTSLTPRLNAVSDVLKLKKGELEGTYYTGFLKQTNYIGNLNFSNNHIAITSPNINKDYSILMNSVVGLTFEGNSFDVDSGIAFTYSYNDQPGVVMKNAIANEDVNGLMIECILKNKYVVLPTATGTIQIQSDGILHYLKLIPGSDYIKIGYEIDSQGNAVIQVQCEEGHTFTGWTVNGTEYNPGESAVITSSMTLTACCN